MRSTRLVWFLAGAASVVLAIAFNPSPERHRTAVKERIAQRSQVAAVLRLGDLTAFASTYHSLGVASYTTVNERTLSFGVLGMVFVFEQGAEK